MTKPTALVEANKREMKKVRSATSSVSERFASVLFGIGDAYIEAGGTFMELASISGDVGSEKRKLIGRFIDETIRGVEFGIITEVTGISLPAGARLFRLCLDVDWDTLLADFIRATCPQTGSDWDIWRVVGQYPSLKKGTTTEEVYLLWYGPGSLTKPETADAWAADNKFVRIHPRVPCSIIGGVDDIVPQLKKLGYPFDGVGVVSTSPCTLGGVSRIPNAWRDSGGGRRAYVDRASNEWNVSSLFAFSRKLPLVQ